MSGAHGGNVTLTFVVTLHLKYPPQIVCAHVMVNLKNDRREVSASQLYRETKSAAE
jgi:hypothetical protein